MVNLENLNIALRKQPVFRGKLKTLAERELIRLLSPVSATIVDEKNSECLKNFLIYNNIVKNMSVQTTWIEDLQTIIKACS